MKTSISSKVRRFISNRSLKAGEWAYKRPSCSGNPAQAQKALSEIRAN
jgi:hypothetical protein